jgi:hypothetical protein
MIRATAWLAVVVLGTGTLCRGQELPTPRPVKEKPRAAKADPAKTKATTDDEKSTPLPPILFPSPPFPPPARLVLDPRTRAWEQVYADFNVVADEGIPPDHHGSVPAAESLRTQMTIGYWLRRFKAGPARQKTIELHKNGQTGQWHVAEVPPQ